MQVEIASELVEKLAVIASSRGRDSESLVVEAIERFIGDSGCY
jgi:predicted transcriptional regulator